MQKRFFVSIVLMTVTLMFSSCNKDGGFLGDLFNKNEQTVASGDLPQAILDYLNTNYPNFSIKKAEKDTDDTGAVIYEIELDTGEELLFDENGNFLGEESDHDDDSDEHDGGEAETDSLTLADLPMAVQDYINANFADYTFESGGQDTLCTGEQVLEVDLEKGNDEVHLIFDLSGNLLYTVTSILSADLPAAITESIAANYANYTTDDEAYQMELADGTLEYQVDLTNTTDNTELDVTFGADGTVICEE